MNADLSRRTGGVDPLRYVDVADPELEQYPQLAAAVADRMRLPMVLVGDRVKHPSGINIYWVEAQLAELGVEPFVSATGPDPAVEEEDI